MAASAEEQASIAELERQLAPLCTRFMALVAAVPPALPPLSPEDEPSPGSSEARLARLVRLCGLSWLESKILLCLMAIECVPRLRQVLRMSQRDEGRPCLELGTLVEVLGLGLAALPEVKRAVGGSGALARCAIIDPDDGDEALPLVSRKLRIATRVVGYLFGDDRLPAEMELLTDVPPTPLREVAAPLLARLDSAQRAGEPLVIELWGRSASECRALLQALGCRLGRPILTLDVADLPPARMAHQLCELRRESLVAGALPALLNWDRLFAPLGPERELDPGAVRRPLPPALREFIEAGDGPLLLFAAEAEPLLGRYAATLCTFEVPFPTPNVRSRLMASALQSEGMVPAPDLDLAAVTRRFALDTELITLSARAAAAATRARGATTVLPSELAQACRQQLKHDLKSVAERVEHSHRWEHLVIPVDVYHSLEAMIAYVRHAPQVYDRWGFAGRHSLSQGVSALFTGPPGTGKTMSASVIARELDMELFRVDLSRVVSKWIGETEKNLSKVFAEAEHSNAIILFDEADALFAKRTEVRSSVDRYANLEVNFLLQRMEAFGGVSILTTNFEDTIDTAFKRRITFKMRFEKPDAGARAALWRKVFPESCELAADVDFARLGERYELSGGNIRNAAVRAAFFAAAAGTAVTMELCQRAAEEEAREMGVLVRSESASAEVPATEPATPPVAPRPKLKEPPIPVRPRR